MSIKKILISQPKPESGKSPYYDIAAKYDAEITFRSFINVEQVSQREFRDQRINILDHSAVIFTTRKAMEHFFGLCAELRITVPEDMKYFCISEQIANYLQFTASVRSSSLLWVIIKKLLLLLFTSTIRKSTLSQLPKSISETFRIC